MSVPPDPLPGQTPPEGDATRYGAAAGDPDATGSPTPAQVDAHATRYSAASADPDATGYTPTPAGAARSTGRRTLPCPFGEYELLEEIARGGMGVDYKARQRIGGGERFLALKMIQAGRLASPEAVERFLQEARAAAKLDHPGIVHIYDVGEIDDRHYFTMPLLTGGSLAERVRDGPLPSPVAARIVRQVAEAVQHAHDQGIIHRDLKPANILLSFSRDAESSERSAPSSGAQSSALRTHEFAPKVTDFGLARIGESNLSVTGEVMGTPSYMPPEQARGQINAMGPASDVYGLGAVLYCLLTGRPPFQSSDPVETMRQVCEDEPIPPRKLNAQVPRDLQTICLKCLRKEPERRYTRTSALADDLGRFLQEEPIQARQTSVIERAWRWARRQPNKTALWLMVILMALVLASWFLNSPARGLSLLFVCAVLIPGQLRARPLPMAIGALTATLLLLLMLTLIVGAFVEGKGTEYAVRAYFAVDPYWRIEERAGASTLIPTVALGQGASAWFRLFFYLGVIPFCVIVIGMLFSVRARTSFCFLLLLLFASASAGPYCLLVLLVASLISSPLGLIIRVVHRYRRGDTADILLGSLMGLMMGAIIGTYLDDIMGTYLFDSDLRLVKPPRYASQVRFSSPMGLLVLGVFTLAGSVVGAFLGAESSRKTIRR